MGYSSQGRKESDMTEVNHHTLTGFMEDNVSSDQGWRGGGG